MNVRVYRNLSDLPASYLNLLNEGASENFFNSPVWYKIISEWAEENNIAIRVYGVVSDDQDEPLGILLAQEGASSSLAAGRRVLEGLQNIYTLHYGPVIARRIQDRRSVIRELAQAIVAEEPRWDTVSFRMLDKESGDLEHFTQALRENGMLVEEFFQYGNWYEEIDNRSFKEYIASLGTSIRTTLARKTRKFERLDNSRFELVRDTTNLEFAIESFNEVYDASWKPAESEAGLVERLIRRTAEAGQLRLGIVYIDDKPLAALLTIVCDGKAIMIKTAYDESAPSNLSLGGVLDFCFMRALIDEDRVSVIDYGIGDEPYKEKWTTKRREKWGLVAYNRRTILGNLLGAGATGRSAVRKVLGSQNTRPVCHQSKAEQTPQGKPSRGS